MGWSGPHLVLMVPWGLSPRPPEPTAQTPSRSVQPFLQGLRLWQTDRPTDHATRSVTIGRIYVRSTAYRLLQAPKKLQIEIPNSVNFRHISVLVWKSSLVYVVTVTLASPEKPVHARNHVSEKWLPAIFSRPIFHIMSLLQCDSIHCGS